MKYEPRFKVGDKVHGLWRDVCGEFYVSRLLTIGKVTIEVGKDDFAITYSMKDGPNDYTEKDLFRSYSFAVAYAEERNGGVVPFKVDDLVYVVVLGNGAFEVKGRFPIKRVIEDDVHTYYIVDHKDGTRREHHNRCVFKSFELALETMTRRNGKGWSLGKDYGMGEARLEQLTADSPCILPQPKGICPHCDMVLE